MYATITASCVIDCVWGLSIADQELKQEVLQNRVLNDQSRIQVIAQLALILQAGQQLNNMTATGFQQVAMILQRMNLPTTHISFGLKRIFDIAYYNANSGMINLFLLSNVQSDPNYNGGAGPITLQTPLYAFYTNNQNGLPPLNINSITRSLQPPRNGTPRFFDLHVRGIISQAQMRAEVQLLPGGFGNADVEVDPNRQ